MYKFITLLALIVLSIGDINAQFFNVSNINTDEFPTVSTIFVAKDNNGEFIKNATVNQFDIKEDGFSVPKFKMDIECFESPDVPELSVVLVVDKSGSMNEPFDDKKPKDTPWERVKVGVESFLDNIQFVGDTKVALVTFNGDSFESCPFTNNPQDIIDSLDAIEPSLGTKYTPPYIKDEFVADGRTYRPSAVSLLKTRPANIKRIAVFLTDGKPDSEPETQRIIDSLNNYNISAYNITFLTAMHQSLSDISQKTDGTAFRVEKKEDLETIYSEIAREAQESYFCKLSWITDYPCYESQTDRNVEFTFTGLSPFGRSSKDYVIPNEHIPIRTFDLPVYSFGNPEVGPINTVTKTIQLIIERVNFKFKDIEIVPSNQGFSLVEIKDSKGNPIANDTELKEGDTVYIDIDFEQFDVKTLRTATVTINGTPCETAVELVGGTSDVILDNPNGGEVYTTCDSIDINWSGVEKEAEVHLSYSNDDFNNDSTFISTSTGNNHNWKSLPQTPGQYKLKLRVDPVSRYIFALDEQSTGQSHGASIELSRDELYVYGVGHFKDSIKVAGTTHYAEGNEDIFIGKFNSAGKNIWFNTIGGSGLDSASGVCVDDEEQVYFTGATTTGTKFNGAGVGGNLPGSIFYVAKTNPNGSTYIVRTIFAKAPYTTFEIWGTKIRYDNATERIIVQGGYTDTYPYVTPLKTYTFPGPGGRFTAYYDKDLKFLDLTFGAVAGDYSDNEATTDDGKSTYNIGTINKNTSFGPFDLVHDGRGDFYINRFGKNEPSTDISDQSFIIEKPTLTFFDNSIYQFGDTPLNEVKLKSENEFIINSSILPIEIDTVTITGVNSDEFYLDRDIDGEILSGAENARDISINFNPQNAGLRNAQLNVFGKCAEVITLQLQGNGICDLAIIDEMNLGSSNLNAPKNKLFESIFINKNNIPIRITPKIIDDASAEFRIINIYINSIPGTVGTSLTLEPYDTLSVEIDFTPIIEGQRLARFEYSPETGACADIKTKIVGVGANTDLEYAEVDFGKKRIQTVNYIDLEINNNGSLPVTLSDVRIENNEVFELELPNVLEVKTDEPLKIRVKFNPQFEGTFSEPIDIIVNKGDDPISLNNVVGIADNPTAIGTLECNGNSVQNKMSPVTLNLKNNSTISETVVQSLTIDASSDYTFVGGGKTKNTVQNIPINNSINIPLEFTPTVVGVNTLDLTISSNTAIGNNIDDVLNDPLEEDIQLNCNAIPADGDIPVVFTGVLVCDEYVKSETIVNENTSQPLSITNYSLTPNGTDFYINKLDNTISIAPSSNHTFDILFAPTSNGIQTATLNITMEQDGSPINKTYSITGEGKRIKYFTIEDEKDVIPGGETKLVVSADIPKLDYPITDLDVIIRHNPEVTSFEENPNNSITLPISNSIDWTWTNSNNYNSQEYIDFSGSTLTEALVEGTYELFEINYIMYLGPIEKDVIAIGDFPDCIHQEFDDVQQINLTGVCALNNRLVQFGIQPEPSSAEFNNNINMIRTEFTVIFDGMDMNIDILDINGNLVESKRIRNLNQGRYESVIEASKISTGLYFVRFSSGSYSDTEKLLIVK